MATHFNAFISYRHHPMDSKIAQTIHRSLERFKIPGAIQKTTGVRKIDRIFRDKEELPLSINLSDDITEALIHSDFLIVICTPRLKESAWCRREIEFFMQLHGRERILIVLAEGEPDDVVPDILMKDQEPLCCDYRMKPRQAKQIELPRLAAAILGCRYDDLVRRQRQYRNRRIAAAASVAMAGTLALAGYYYKTSREIQANYEQSLRNQSQFLANASRELLDDGDRLTAIQLALEALPSEGNERPWVADAEYALSEAVMAYSSSEEIAAINAFTHTDWVVDYEITPDGAYLISWDQTNRFYVWDTATYQLLHTIQTPTDLSYRPVEFAADDHIITMDYDKIYCYSYLEGTLVWEISDFRAQDIVVSEDGLTLAAAGTHADGLQLIDTATGNVCCRAALPTSWVQSYQTMRPLCFSADGSMLALEYETEVGKQVLLYDVQEEHFSLCDTVFYVLEKACFNASNELIVSGALEDRDGSGFISQMGFYNILENQADVFCFRMDSKNPVWQNEVHYYLPGHDAFLMICDYPGVGQVVACTYGNVCDIFDAHTGEKLQHLEMRDTAQACEYFDDGILHWYLNDGSYCNNQLGYGDVYSIKYFVSNLVDGITHRGAYVRAEGSNQIIFYRASSDDSWIPFTDGQELNMCDVLAVNDSHLVVSLGYKAPIRCYDVQNRSLLWEMSGEEEGDILGITRSGKYVVEFDSIDNILRLHDVVTGKMQEQTLEPTPAEGYNTAYRHSGATALAGNALAYIVQSENVEVTKGEDGSITVHYSEEKKWELCVLDLNTGNETRRELPELQAAMYSDVCLVPDGQGSRILVIWKDQDGITHSGISDAGEGTFTPLEDPGYMNDYSEAVAAWWGEYLALRDAAGLWLYDMTTMEKTLLDGEGSNAVSIYFANDRVMVLYEDITLRVYNLVGGLEHRREILSASYTISGGSEVQWDTCGDTLIVSVNDVCTLIDMESWEYYSYLRNYICYDSVDDGFCTYIYGTNGYTLAFYQRYTTDMLIERARGLLGSNVLSEELRERYGLSQ